MSTREKLKAKLLSGKRMSFEELRTLLSQSGFNLNRINGDHYIYKYLNTNKIVNVQPCKGGKTKDYQLKQIIKLFKELNL